MDLNDYQKQIIKFDLYGDVRGIGQVDMTFLDKILGLSGESGEVADKVKKIIRDQGGEISAQDKEALKKELGDILWYLATSARYLGFSLDEIARQNLIKLEDRLNRGKISGQGDDR